MNRAAILLALATCLSCGSATETEPIVVPTGFYLLTSINGQAMPWFRSPPTAVVGSVQVVDSAKLCIHPNSGYEISRWIRRANANGGLDKGGQGHGGGLTSNPDGSWSFSESPPLTVSTGVSTQITSTFATWEGVHVFTRQSDTCPFPFPF